MSHNENYKIGFGKPPQHARFQPGKSGNSKGRPKGAKNLATLVTNVLDAKVTVTLDGKRRGVTKRMLIITQLVNQAAAGNMKALPILLTLMHKLNPSAEENRSATDPRPTQSDDEIMRDLTARFSTVKSDRTENDE